MSRHGVLQHAQSDLNPTWGTRHGMAVPLRFSPSGDFDDLALGDLSCLPKVGLKGPAAEEWLGRRGIPLPDSVYDWQPLESGGLIVRVDRREFFLEDGFGEPVVSGISEDLHASPAGVHRIERQDAGLLVSGARAWQVLAQTCGYRFDPPPPVLVLTRVAGVSCPVLRLEARGVPAFRIWCAPAFALYLWETLLTIVRDLGGGPIGIDGVTA